MVSDLEGGCRSLTGDTWMVGKSCLGLRNVMKRGQGSIYEEKKTTRTSFTRRRRERK